MDENKSMFITIAAVLIITFLVAGCQNTTTTPTPIKTEQQEKAVVDTKNNVEKTEEQPQANQSEVKEFTIEAYQFGYRVPEIKVKEGDKVKITLITRDVPHSF